MLRFDKIDILRIFAHHSTEYFYYYLSNSEYEYYGKTYNKFELHGPYISNYVWREDNGSGSMNCSPPDNPTQHFYIHDIQEKSWFIVDASRKVFLTRIMANAEIRANAEIIKTQSSGGKSSRHKRKSRKIKRRSKLRSNRRR